MWTTDTLPYSCLVQRKFSALPRQDLQEETTGSHVNDLEHPDYFQSVVPQRQDSISGTFELWRSKSLTEASAIEASTTEASPDEPPAGLPALHDVSSSCEVVRPSQKKKFKFQKNESTTAEHCCVPLCQTSSKSNKVLSFHTFPSNEETKQKWIVAIRRCDFTVTPHTRVCSRHFKEEDICEPSSETGRRMLKQGAIPALFEWNNYFLPPSRLMAGDASQNASVHLDHDYTLALKEEVNQVKQEIEDQAITQRFGLQRFAGSDRDICFFTRFASYKHLIRFWALIEPALPNMVTVIPTPRGNFTEPSCSSTHSLQPIDELFMFLNYVALGSTQCDLAERYGVQQSTVNVIIITWSNFLYTILGSLMIWMPEEKIREHMPAKFKGFEDTAVMLAYTELRCQYPSSFFLQSEGFSKYNSRCTLKGLLGVSPHGAVTFTSRLYAGSMSDKQIVADSGILSLLSPGMAIMVNRDFPVCDFVPCKIYRLGFRSGRSRMSACEVRETQATTCLRLHVEQQIQRVKQHKLFDIEIPVQLFHCINQLYTVACLLTNYESELLE
ncbi:uncharacterized protein KZ484_024280 [Pholidichthys leucotaenia]